MGRGSEHHRWSLRTDGGTPGCAPRGRNYRRKPGNRVLSRRHGRSIRNRDGACGQSLSDGSVCARVGGRVVTCKAETRRSEAQENLLPAHDRSGGRRRASTVPTAAIMQCPYPHPQRSSRYASTRSSRSDLRAVLRMRESRSQRSSERRSGTISKRANDCHRARESDSVRQRRAQGSVHQRQRVARGANSSSRSMIPNASSGVTSTIAWRRTNASISG